MQLAIIQVARTRSSNSAVIKRWTTLATRCSDFHWFPRGHNVSELTKWGPRFIRDKYYNHELGRSDQSSQPERVHSWPSDPRQLQGGAAHSQATSLPQASLCYIAKAFDTVNRCFLLCILEFMGFSRRWLNWISMLLSSASTKVVLNGSPGQRICHARGLRQGGPLPPLAFCHCHGGLEWSSACGNALEGLLLSFEDPCIKERVFFNFMQTTTWSCLFPRASRTSSPLAPSLIFLVARLASYPTKRSA